MNKSELLLLPAPRFVRRLAGTFQFPSSGVLHLDPALPRDEVMLPVAARLKKAFSAAGACLELITGPAKHPKLVMSAARNEDLRSGGYNLTINARGLRLEYADEPGLRAGAATVVQLIRQFGRVLPSLIIRDFPDFARRGVMLDVSRGRVPRLETLIELADHLADFKINELQLYTEHTFAYRKYEAIWRDWGALTGEEMLRLDAHCRRLGIDLIPNQNSFGHLRYWLEHPPLRKLAETNKPWPDQGGAFLRFPATLAPNHPGTLPFLRGLYDELLPHFTSGSFNVGCDETWDLGRGQSRAACEKSGKGRVYLKFLKRIHAEVTARGKQMMFWGDIILHYPELVAELPNDVVALNWGYEANHPFDREAGTFAQSKIPFYVCPGTATWMTLIGRHDTALANLKAGAAMGLKHGARGYLNTDWGDGGHPQPLAVSYIPFLAGAALSWCGESYDERLLIPVLNRDVFQDASGHAAEAAYTLGFAHRKFDYYAHNVTPFGAVIAAPRPETRELFCRDGLKYYARIPENNIRSACAEVEAQLKVLSRATPAEGSAVLTEELRFAARMAAQSCQYMLWQQAVAGKNLRAAKQIAKPAIRELLDLDSEFNAYWPRRNQGTTIKCSPFLKWRVEEYRRGELHFPPAVAALERKSTSAD